MSIFWLIPAFGLGYWACKYELIIKPERRAKREALESTDTINEPLRGTECE